MKRGVFATLLIGVAFCVAILLTACGPCGSSVLAWEPVETLSSADTLWFSNGEGFDVQRPFVENGRRVLYRHVTFYDGDTEVMDYVYIPRGSHDHGRRVKAVYGDVRQRRDLWDDMDTPDPYALHGSPYTHVNLGDMPREWFQVVRFKGVSVFSADFPYSMYFTDSTLVFHDMEDWVVQLRGVEPMPDGGYAVSLGDYDYGNDTVVTYLDTLSPLGKECRTRFSLRRHNMHYTPSEHLKDFDLIDVDNWTELLDPLDSDYEL